MLWGGYLGKALSHLCTSASPKERSPHPLFHTPPLHLHLHLHHIQALNQLLATAAGVSESDDDDDDMDVSAGSRRYAKASCDLIVMIFDWMILAMHFKPPERFRWLGFKVTQGSEGHPGLCVTLTAPMHVLPPPKKRQRVVLSPEEVRDKS